MEKDEIKEIISNLNVTIKDLENSKRTLIYLFEPQPPRKLILVKNIKPHFFLIKNGIVTTLKILFISVLVFILFDNDKELTLKISVITLLIILTYDYFIKYSEKVKSYKITEECNIKQSIKFDEENKLYNQKIKKYGNDKIENDLILKYNSDIDKKIKISKDEINMLLEKLTKNIDLFNNVEEIRENKTFVNRPDNLRSKNKILNYYTEKIQTKKKQNNMKIICRKCKNTETVNISFFVKIIGGALPIGGFWAWTTYLLAGTGLALPIVTAMIIGGTSMLIFKDKIVKWILEKKYKCSKCGSIDWDV